MADIKGRTIAATYGKLLYTSTDDGLVGNTGSTTSVVTTDDMDGTSTASCLNLGIDRVGIGTAAPDSLLVLEGTSAEVALTIGCHSDTIGHAGTLNFRKKDVTEDGESYQVDDNDVLGIIGFQGWDNDTYLPGAQIIARMDGEGTNNSMPCDLEFWTNTGAAAAEQQMTLSRQGHLGIGEGALVPSNRLHVTGGGNGSYVAIFDNTGDGSTAHGIIIKAGDDGHDDNDTHDIQFLESGGVEVGELDSDSGNLALSDASDERLKKNIVDTATKGLDIVNGTKMRDFKWKRNDISMECGIIAQELQQVFPRAVKEGDDEDKTLRIRKTDFIYVLVKAVQELSAKVEALENNN